MRALWLALPFVGLVACGGDTADEDDKEDELSPSGDEDGDGYTNGEEERLGSDPHDAGDIPYEGGWAKGQCRDDIQAEGNEVGQVAENFSLKDQYGQDWYLHDFCHEALLIEFSGFS